MVLSYLNFSTPAARSFKYMKVTFTKFTSSAKFSTRVPTPYSSLAVDLLATKI
jgi:hypothetical protein